MKLAKVHKGIIFDHFDGERSQVVYKTFDEYSIVPLPQWALEFRENNIKNGYSRTYLVWDYVNKVFTEFKPMPDYVVSMVSTKYLLRQVRNKVLTATDFMMTVTDMNLTTQQRNELSAYRQELRDLTTDEYLNDVNVIEQYFLANDDLKFVHEFFPPCPSFISGIVEPILAEKLTISRETIDELLLQLEN
jgi:hypothetical protein